MSGFQYRVIGTSGSEIGIVTDARQEIVDGDSLTLPDGSTATVLEVYDDEDGREGGVEATLAVDAD